MALFMKGHIHLCAGAMVDDIGWMRERLGIFAHYLLLGRIQDLDLDVDNTLMYVVAVHCAAQQHRALHTAISPILQSLLNASCGACTDSLLHLCVSSNFSDVVHV